MAKLDESTLFNGQPLADLLGGSTPPPRFVDVIIGQAGNGYIEDDVDIFLASGEDIYSAFSQIWQDYTAYDCINIYIRKGNYPVQMAISFPSREIIITGESMYNTKLTISQSSSAAFDFSHTYNFKMSNIGLHIESISSAYYVFSGSANHVSFDQILLSSSATTNSLEFITVAGGISDLTISNSILDMGSVGTITNLINYPVTMNIKNTEFSGRSISTGPVISGGSAGKLIIDNCNASLARVSGGSDTEIIIKSSTIGAVYSMSNARIMNNIIVTNCNINDTADTYCINNIILAGEVYNNTANGNQSSKPFSNAVVSMNVGPDIANILVE